MATTNTKVVRLSFATEGGKTFTITIPSVQSYDCLRNQATIIFNGALRQACNSAIMYYRP